MSASPRAGTRAGSLQVEPPAEALILLYLLSLRARFTFLDGSPSASIWNDLALARHGPNAGGNDDHPSAPASSRVRRRGERGRSCRDIAAGDGCGADGGDQSPRRAGL